MRSLAIGIAAAFLFGCSRASSPPPSPSPPRTIEAERESGGAALLAEARRELAAMRQSNYSHKTRVDEASGTFEYDCSGFLDYAIERVATHAYEAVRAARSSRPLAAAYERLLESPPPASGWRSLSRVDGLRSGDVIAWVKPEGIESRDTGHVMIAASTPLARAGQPGEYEVVVIDSAASGHGNGDTRTATGNSGLGTGTIVLRVNEAGAPIGYRWSTLGVSKLYETPIALGRLE